MTRNVPHTEALARDSWRDALEHFTKIHQGDGATIEIVDRNFGDQVEATEVLPLTYIEYDPKDDVVVVAVGGQTARFPVVTGHARPALRGSKSATGHGAVSGRDSSG